MCILTCLFFRLRSCSNGYVACYAPIATRTKTKKTLRDNAQVIQFPFLRSEDLIIPESMAQDFGFTGVLGKQEHSRLRNNFSSASMESKEQSGSGIIESSLLREVEKIIAQFSGSFIPKKVWLRI